MSNLFSLLPGVLAITRPHEHGPQLGGALHQRATRGRDGFMTKKQARQLQELMRRSAQEQSPVAGLLPTSGSYDFRQPFSPSRAVLDPDMVNQEIRRSDSFAVGPARYSLTARPGWLVVQSPRNGLTHFAVQIPFPAVNDRKTWLVPTFADLPQNTLGSPDVFGGMTFSIGQTDEGAIDGNNLVFCQITQSGGIGTLPQNSWDIYFGAIELGGLVHSEPIKVVTGAPPVAVVFVKGTDSWHIEVLLAGNTPAHVSQEFNCDITPDRFSWGLQTAPGASHSIVRGVQGLYAFDTDNLIL